MTNTNQAAAVETVAVKTGWVKPEIVTFTPAATAQGNGGTVTNDGAQNNLS